jgi:hypothetical protein
LADGLVKKLQFLRERFEQPEVDGQPVDIEVSEEEANAYIVHRLADQLPEGVVEPWVKFSDGPVWAGAVLDLALLRDRLPESSLVQLLSGRVPVQLSAKVQTDDGVGKLELGSVTLAGISLPESFLQEIVTAYTKSPSRPDGIRLDAPFTLPYGIVNARIEEGRLHLRQGRSGGSQ